jgi:hypothetical protein
VCGSPERYLGRDSTSTEKRRCLSDCLHAGYSKAAHDDFSVIFRMESNPEKIFCQNAIQPNIVDAFNEDFESNFNFPFRTTAEQHCIVENSTHCVVVPWVGVQTLCQNLKQARFPSRHLVRKLQPYVVQVRDEVVTALLADGALDDFFGDGALWLLSDEKLYDPDTGLLPTKNSYR